MSSLAPKKNSVDIEKKANALIEHIRAFSYNIRKTIWPGSKKAEANSSRKLRSQIEYRQYVGKKTGRIFSIAFAERQNHLVAHSWFILRCTSTYVCDAPLKIAYTRFSRCLLSPFFTLLPLLLLQLQLLYTLPRHCSLLFAICRLVFVRFHFNKYLNLCVCVYIYN